MSPDYLRVLVQRDRPVRMPDGTWVEPDRVKIRADLSHLALGLWAGYIFVLFAPGPKGSPKMTEKHLMHAYSGVMNVFSLL